MLTANAPVAPGRDAATHLRITHFDLNRHPDDELAVVVARAVGFFVAAPYALRLITRAEPASLAAPIAALTARMAVVPRAYWPALDSEQLYLEWATAHLVLRDLTSHLLVWTGGGIDPGPLAGLASERFGTPATPVEALPPLFTGRYEEYADYLAPVGWPAERPYLRVLVAYQQRGEWTPRTLHALLHTGYRLALVQDVQTPPPGRADVDLSRAQQSLGVQIEVAANQGEPDLRSESAAAHCRRATLEVLAGQRLHRVAHLVLLGADTVAELDQATQTVSTELAPVLPLRVERGRQAAVLGYFSATPTSALPAVPHWPTLTQGLAVELAFGVRSSSPPENTGPVLGRDEAGFLVRARGWHKPGAPGAPESRDMLVTGEKGGGKTFFVLKAALNEVVHNDVQVVILEPQRHGRRLVDAVGDQAVDPEGQGRFHDINFAASRINLLDVVEANLPDQVSHVIRLFEVLLTAERVQLNPGGGGLFTPAQRGALDQALQEEYGAGWQALTPATTPRLRDLCARLRGLNKAGRRLAQDLDDLFVSSSLGAIFDQPTNLPLRLDEARVLAFSVFEIQERYRPFVYGLWTGAVRRRTRRKPARQKLIAIIDEFGYLAREQGLLEEVAMEMKTCRTFWTAWWLAEQSARTFEGTAWGRLIADIVSDQFYFRQTGTAPEIAKRLNPQFTDAHLEMMRSATTGWAVARIGEAGEVFHVYVDPTGYEYKMFGGS